MKVRRVRPALLPADGEALRAIWDDALGETWPVAPGALERRMQDATVLIAEADGGPAGFIAARDGGGGRGSIFALAVLRAARRKGLATALIAEALAALRGRGVTTVGIGPGAGAYCWPGVPAEQVGALACFERAGAAFTGITADMTLDLAGYRTPPGVLERAAAAGVTLAPAGPVDGDAIVAFEQKHFPEWLEPFRDAVTDGRFTDVLLARDAAGAVVGTSLIDAPDPGFIWAPLLPGAAAFGCVGVAEAARSRGTGLALSARSCEILRDRGERCCYLGWVWSAEWYAQLGFRVWRTYVRGSLG